MAWAELATALLPDVRSFLDITWADADGDKKLVGIIARGMANIQRLTARTLIFEEGTKERELLFEYCRYARAGALDEFARNYRTDIITFREDEVVRSAISPVDFTVHVNQDGDLMILAEGDVPPLSINEGGDLVVVSEDGTTQMNINDDGYLIYNVR